MKLFPEDPLISIGATGFDDKDKDGRPYDLLGRKPLGQRLTDIVDRIDQPLVIALDGGWGSGKSHFLKLWAGGHSRELGGKAEVIYFDAFEHDYLDDPLVSLVGCLASGTHERPWRARALARLKKAAFPLVKFTLRLGAAAATAGATELASPVLDAVIGKAAVATDDTIERFWKAETDRIAAMKAFREALASLTKPENDGGPTQKIVFIVDELDRCRPDYALTLLEIVKHFFAVPNVHFVLGANLSALDASVRHRYGDWSGSGKYLQKFVHLILSFPVQRNHEGHKEWAGYFDQLAADMGFRQTHRAKETLGIYGNRYEISLRDTQRFMTRLVLLPQDIYGSGSSYQYLVMSALVMQVFRPTLYAALRANQLDFLEIEQTFPLAATTASIYKNALNLHHLWRRVLLDQPGAATLAATERAFDVSFTNNKSGHFDALWRDAFDDLQLPPSASA